MAEGLSSAPVATAYTLDFVLRSLPPGARDLLEIGCGSGELAAALAGDGFTLLALDSDAGCVEQARSRGVDARHGEWPLDLDGRFDAVLFTRSLHHVGDLAESVAAARRVLRSGGRIIVEDFRAEGGTARSSEWYRSMVEELAQSGALAEGTDRAALIAKIAPPDHEHELHGSAAIETALRSDPHVTATDAAYYFRYLEPHLRERGAAKWLLEVEVEQIAEGAIDALGKRYVALG